jgi:HIV Tat-specific factor 1
MLILLQPKKPNKKTRPDTNGALKERKNTSIYVTNIPLDATADEIVSVFSKAGMISESIVDGQKRVKMYNDDAGKFKGEALITYFREEAIENSLMLFDDADFRFGVKGPGGTMKVTKADFSRKKEAGTGEEKEKGPRELTEWEKQKAKKRGKKMNEYVVYAHITIPLQFQLIIYPANSPTGTTTTPPPSNKLRRAGTKSS